MAKIKDMAPTHLRSTLKAINAIFEQDVISVLNFKQQFFKSFKYFYLILKLFESLMVLDKSLLILFFRSSAICLRSLSCLTEDEECSRGGVHPRPPSSDSTI